MTALRAPTGGSSDGGDDDASAETVSDHGDSLREIALLIDALRDDDVAARQRSHAALPKIAAALGPRRCRDELVPFVCDLTDDVDGVLLELATRLAELGPLVGGARHAHVRSSRSPSSARRRTPACAPPRPRRPAASARRCPRRPWPTARALRRGPRAPRVVHGPLGGVRRAGRVAAARGRRAARHRSGARGRRRAGGAARQPRAQIGDLARLRQAREGGGWWAGGDADVVEVLRKLAADDQDAVRLACVAALEKVAASPHQRGN